MPLLLTAVSHGEPAPMGAQCYLAHALENMEKT